MFYMKYLHIRKITVVALLSGIGFLLMMLEISVPLIPSFIKLDISDFPALVAAFIFGPVEGIVVCLIKNCLHIAATYSGGIGELANFMLSATFVLTAGFIYKRFNSFKGSVIACFAGSIAMAAISFPVNLFITYPFYSKFMPIDTIIKAYQDILPSVGSLELALLIFNVPFTLIKGLIVSVLCLVSYKRLSYLYIPQKGQNC